MSTLFLPSKKLLNVRFSPNNECLLALTAVEVQGPTLQGSLHIVEVTPQNTLKEIRRFDYPGYGLYDVEWCDDSTFPSYVLTSAGDGKLQLWNVYAPKNAPALLKGHINEIHTIHRCKLTGKVLSGSCDYTIRLWDVDEKKTISQFTNNEGNVHHVEFHPKLNLFAAASGDLHLRIWDISSPLPVSSVQADYSITNSCSWNKFDDNVIATGGGDGMVRGWDIRNLTCPIFQLSEVFSPMRKIIFSPFSIGSLASISYNGMTHLWNHFDSQDPLLSLRGHKGFASGLDWNSIEHSPNLRLLTDCGWDGVVSVYSPGPL